MSTSPIVLTHGIGWRSPRTIEYGRACQARYVPHVASCPELQKTFSRSAGEGDLPRGCATNCLLGDARASRRERGSTRERNAQKKGKEGQDKKKKGGRGKRAHSKTIKSNRPSSTASSKDEDAIVFGRWSHAERHPWAAGALRTVKQAGKIKEAAQRLGTT